eukprot:234893-Rhodomonas_salina.1
MISFVGIAVVQERVREEDCRAAERGARDRADSYLSPSSREIRTSSRPSSTHAPSSPTPARRRPTYRAGLMRPVRSAISRAKEME